MKASTESYEELFQDQEYHSLYTNLAMIGDPSILVRTLKLFSEFNDIDQFQTHFIEDNPFHYSTRSYRQRLFTSIKKLILGTYNDAHRQLLTRLGTVNLNQSFYKLALYLQVGINSRLFREITLEVFSKKKRQGALKITKHSIEDFVLENTPVSEEWSDTTLNRLGSRYLTLMYMLGFIEGEDRQKISVFSPSRQQLAYTVYLDQCLTEGPYIRMEAPIFQLLFLHDYEGFLNKLKDLSLDGFFDLEVAGGDVKVQSMLEVDQLVDKLTG